MFKLNKMPKRAVLCLGILLAVGLSACSQNTTAANTADNSSNQSATQADAHQHHDTNPADANAAEHIKAYMTVMENMHTATADTTHADSANVAYIKAMIPHHQAALGMAYIQLKYGQDASLKDLAQNIIDTQQAEISWMNEWLNKHAETEPSTDTKAMQDDYAKKDAINHEQMMAGITDANPDAAFAKGMIPHHQGAIDMSQIALAHGADGEIAKLAQDIMDAQVAEIDQMQAWLKKHK